jgi:hypothetical protein
MSAQWFDYCAGAKISGNRAVPIARVKLKWFHMRQFRVFLLRTTGKMLLCRLADASSAPSENCEAPPFDRIRHAVRVEGMLLHGSPHRLDLIEPRSRYAGQGPFVYATDNALRASLRALSKLGWNRDSAYRLIPDAIPGMHYSLFQFDRHPRCSAEYCFVSLHEKLWARVDPNHTVYVHLVRAEPFRLYRQGWVTRWTAGEASGSCEWVADTPVPVERVVEVSLKHLPCPIALHRSGTTYLQALLRYRLAPKAQGL